VVCAGGMERVDHAAEVGAAEVGTAEAVGAGVGRGVVATRRRHEMNSLVGEWIVLILEFWAGVGRHSNNANFFNVRSMPRYKQPINIEVLHT